MMGSTSMTFLVLLLGVPFSTAFSPTTTLKLHQQQHGASLLTLHAADTTDDYDAWLDALDPSAFEEDTVSASSSSTGSSSSRRSNNERGARPTYARHDYQRDYQADDSRIDEAAVDQLIGERLQARKTGQFETADAIRDALLEDHGVRINDRERMWRTGCSSSGSGRQWGGGRGGRDNNNDRRGGGRLNDERRASRRKNFGPNGHDYSLSSDSGPSTSPLGEPMIHEMLAERLQAKLSRNFRVADAIQQDLIQNGVFVHDQRKEWRADGVGFGADERGGGRGGGRVQPTGPYQMSDFSEALSADDATATEQLKARIQELVDERLEARLDSNYNVADAIREDLQRDYNVIIDDRSRQWSVGGAFHQPPGPYEMSTFSLPIASLIPEGGDGEDDDDAVQTDIQTKIQSMIEERLQAKLARDYRTADVIQDDLRSMYNCEVRDRERQYSIGGQFEPPKEPYRMSSHSNEPTTITPQEVDEMVQERVQARTARDYDLADDIKFTLLEEHNIAIDDKLQQWAVDGNFGPQTETENGPSSNNNNKDPRGAFVRRGGGSLTENQERIIEQLLETRMEYKKNREFGKADTIRDRLMSDFNIRVDDRTMEWHIVTNSYVQMKSSHNNNLDEQALEYIQNQVNQRAVAKLNSDYETADNIRDALLDQFGVSIDDRVKEWYVVAGGMGMETETEIEEVAINDEDDDDDSIHNIESQEDDDDDDSDAVDELKDEIAHAVYNENEAAGEETVDEDEYYEAETVVDARMSKETGDWEYRVQWKGCPGQDTWEPGSNLDESLYTDALKLLKLRGRLEEEEDDKNDIDIFNEEIEDAMEDEPEEDSELALDSLTVTQLKEHLRAKGLPVSGRKAELIERLQQA